ncbi:hypothetical protein BKA70DRAFT_1445091 [Coprinopsis sp. MPI-PUGE-AT-0042]|nr:hypothetical protein BKA70DRAFT_1445091 [Coprinopsis sp. MPI-PUGE-AT-0042]
MTCGTDLQDAALPFMQRHGEKLQYFQSNPLLMSLFSHCPNVTRWDCDNYLPLGVHDAWNFNMLTPGVQYALRTIVVTWHSFCPEDLVDLLDTDLSCLPHLATIHVRGLSWPTCERDIEKSPWITPVETLSKERGITVTNGQGRGWVPRLKPETNKEKRRR